MGAFIKNATGNLTDYNDEAALKKRLGGKVFREAAFLTTLPAHGGFVFVNVDTNDSEHKIRLCFDEAFGDLNFNEIFEMPVFVASKNGNDEYDLVLPFRIRSGGSTKDARKKIAAFPESKVVADSFPNGFKTLSSYRHCRGVSKKRTASSLNKDANSDGDDESSVLSTSDNVESNNVVVVPATPLENDENDDDSIVNSSAHRNLSEIYTQAFAEDNDDDIKSEEVFEDTITSPSKRVRFEEQ